MSEPGRTHPEVTAILALKRAAHAKSRLALPLPLRRRLAWTMALDTLRALNAVVGRVVVVSDQPGLAGRLEQGGVTAIVIGDGGTRGLNAALTRGAAQADGAVLACVGDLPALRPASMSRVLDAVASGGLNRWFLADASGVGTTMLGVRGEPLRPHFQGGSAAAHASSGAVGLDDARLGGPVPDARCDVDTEADLETAVGLGLGAATRALVRADGRLGEFRAVTVRRTPDGYALVADDAARHALDAAVVDRALWTADRRLHAVVDGDRVLSAWLPEVV